MNRQLVGIFTAILTHIMSGCSGSGDGINAIVDEFTLPYDNSNPVFYDNDWTNDYVDWYLMALASAGAIDYRGISTSSSIAPYNKHMTADDLAKQVAKRTETVQRGRKSGMRNIPDPLPGANGNLIRPTSGNIEDTVPIDSPGSRRVVEEAMNASHEKPLIVIVGGPLTTVASAYLFDNTIADRVVVAFLDNHNNGMSGFNGWSDGWAAYITLKRLRLIHFTVESKPFANVPKDRLYELPDSSAREYMLASIPDIVSPEGDADGPAAISIMRPEYIRKVKRVSFDGWKNRKGHKMPVFKDDPEGSAYVVIEVDRDVATDEWWRAMTSPQTWGNQ